MEAVFLGAQFALLPELLSFLTAEGHMRWQRLNGIVSCAHLAGGYANFTVQFPQNCEPINALPAHVVGSPPRLLEAEDQPFNFRMYSAWGRIFAVSAGSLICCMQASPRYLVLGTYEDFCNSSSVFFTCIYHIKPAALEDSNSDDG